MTARVLSVLIWVHAAGRVRLHDALVIELTYICTDHGWVRSSLSIIISTMDLFESMCSSMKGDTAWSEPRIQCGALGATSLSLLSILSIRPLRNSNYELFLAIHFILSLSVYSPSRIRLSINNKVNVTGRQRISSQFVLPRPDLTEVRFYLGSAHILRLKYI
jgi:hypothetical protein